MQETEKIWMNGELVDWADAKVHVGVHGLHYGTGVFEGIRCYETPKGPAVFRLRDHCGGCTTRRAALHGDAVRGRGAPRGDARARRRQRAARVLHPADRVLRLRRARRLDGGQPGRDRDHELALGRYLGERTPTTGIRAKISSWKRVGAERDPARREGDRHLPQLDARGHEAQRGGYDEAILLTDDGYVADGPGENIFVVKDGDDPHAAALDLDPARDHARHGDHDRARPRLRGRGGEPHPRRPVPRRRGLHDRHRRRGDAGALGRRHRDRGRPGHARAAEGVPRHGARRREPLGRTGSTRRGRRHDARRRRERPRGRFRSRRRSSTSARRSSCSRCCARGGSRSGRRSTASRSCSPSGRRAVRGRRLERHGRAAPALRSPASARATR